MDETNLPPMKPHVLIVDDDQAFVSDLRQVLEGRYEVVCAHSTTEFSDMFTPHVFDLVVLDLRLEDDREGLDILRTIRIEQPTLPVLMVTGYPDLDTAVEALKAGAVDYIQKDRVDPVALSKIVDSMLREGALRTQVDHLRRRIETLGPVDLIGRSPRSDELREKIKTAAQDGEATILIRGESGTGKELVAESIHRTGVRKSGPFVKVLIAGLHKDSLHSDLFGHEKGAYTGAIGTRKGCIELAHHGVLFLDEIGDLDMKSQIKLLDVLESQRITRLGGERSVPVDVQFVAATHRDMEELVEGGLFREDLYYRLRCFEIEVCPLRQRKDDIMLLARHFLEQMQIEGRTTARAFSVEVANCLLDHPWAGNVRELRNVVEFAGMQARSAGLKEISPSLLPGQFAHPTKRSPDPKSNGLQMDVNLALAKAELDLVRNGVEIYGRQKSALARELGYSDRFTFRRRIQRILGRYPALREEFPCISEMFPAPAEIQDSRVTRAGGDHSVDLPESEDDDGPSSDCR